MEMIGIWKWGKCLVHSKIFPILSIFNTGAPLTHHWRMSCKTNPISGQTQFLSFRLGMLTAAAMLCKDVPVYLFSSYVPTPFVVSLLPYIPSEVCNCDYTVFNTRCCRAGPYWFMLDWTCQGSRGCVMWLIRPLSCLSLSLSLAVRCEEAGCSCRCDGHSFSQPERGQRL